MLKIKPSHWGFWTFWVCVNAIASFGWAIVLDKSASHILGMVVGICVFIVGYAMLDAHLLEQGHEQWHAALKLGVYIKAALQLLNMGMLFDWIISLEIWAGLLALVLIGDGFGIGFSIDSTAHPFWFALMTTLLTGAILSILVGILTGFAKLYQNQRHSKTLNAQQD